MNMDAEPILDPDLDIVFTVEEWNKIAEDLGDFSLDLGDYSLDLEDVPLDFEDIDLGIEADLDLEDISLTD